MNRNYSKTKRLSQISGNLNANVHFEEIQLRDIFCEWEGPNPGSSIPGESCFPPDGMALPHGGICGCDGVCYEIGFDGSPIGDPSLPPCEDVSDFVVGCNIEPFSFDNTEGTCNWNFNNDGCNEDDPDDYSCCEFASCENDYCGNWSCGCKISSACNYDADANSCHPDDSVGFINLSCCVISEECCDGGGFNLISEECTNYCIGQGWSKGEVDFELGPGIVDITILDIVMMVGMTLGTTTVEDVDICAFWAADVNNDNFIDILDIQQQVGDILEQPPPVFGCIDPSAINCTSQICCDDTEYYFCDEEPSEGYATITDWCMYGDYDFLTYGDYFLFSGCSDPSAINYSPLATFSHSCYYTDDYGDEITYSDCRGNIFTQTEVYDKLNNIYCNYRENEASSDFIDDKMDLYCIGGFYGSNPNDVPYFLWDNNNCPGNNMGIYEINQYSTAFNHQWWLNNWGQRLPYGGRLPHPRSLYLTEYGEVGWHGDFNNNGIWSHPTNHSHIITNLELPYETSIYDWYDELSYNTNETNRYIKTLQYTDSTWFAQFDVGNKSISGVDINYKDVVSILGWDRLHFPENFDGKRTIVTVVDSGIDWNHEALKDFYGDHPRVVRKQMPFSESMFDKPYGVFCNNFYHGPLGNEYIEPDSDGFYRFYGWNYSLHKEGQPLDSCGVEVSYITDTDPLYADCFHAGRFVNEMCMTTNNPASDISSYYFFDNKSVYWPNSFDLINHGARVAGIVGGSFFYNGEGVQGICPSCYIYPVQMSYSNTKGELSSYDDFIRSDSDVATHSHSGGVTMDIYNNDINAIRLFWNLLRYAIEESGKIMVNASGNDNNNLQRDWCDDIHNTIDDFDFFVEGYKKCNTLINWHPLTLVVAGIRPDGKKVPFSTYGTRVDVSAPAVNVLTTTSQPHNFSANNFQSWNFQPNYNLSGLSGNFIPENPDVYGGEDNRDSSALSFVNGTSFASPQVSGTVALMISVNPSLVEPDGYFELHEYISDDWSNINWQEGGHNWCYDSDNNSYVFQCVSNEGDANTTQSCSTLISNCVEEEPGSCEGVCGEYTDEYSGGTLPGYSCDGLCCYYGDCGIDFCQQCGNDVVEYIGNGGYCNNECWWCDLTPSCEYPYDDCVGTCPDPPVECTINNFTGYSPDECFESFDWEYSNYIEFNWGGNPGCVIYQICMWIESLGTWGCGTINDPDAGGVIMYGFSCESTMDFKIISTDGQQSNVITITTSSYDCNGDGDVPIGYQCGEEEEMPCENIGDNCTSNLSPDENYLCNQDSIYCFCDCALQCIDFDYET